MTNSLEALINVLHENEGRGDKSALAKLVAKKFSLTKDRSVYYCRDFAVRFSSSAQPSFSNTVLSLSNLMKVDDRPFIVCLVTPTKNYAFLANTTFLKKISHSSHKLRTNNIRGSFNGSDIVREFNGLANRPENFDSLYNIHAEIGFEGNLARLVEATNNIVPTGEKFVPNPAQLSNILCAPARAIKFVASEEAKVLKGELDAQVEKYKNEILLAALIENVNVRGRVIEYLIAGEDGILQQKLVDALNDSSLATPQFKTKNELGDYARDFEGFVTQTDVKTKIMVLNSNPKAYNLDKVIEFLSTERSVFMFYFVGLHPGKSVETVMISMFQKKLLEGTILLPHWAGRNARGVSQFEGKTIHSLILSPDDTIEEEKSSEFLEEILNL